MIALFVILGALGADPEPSTPNQVFDALTGQGLSLADRAVVLPTPALSGEVSEATERMALKSITGSERAIPEFTRNSVNAPILLKTRDIKVGEAGTIRIADLWFVVHASIDEIKPDTITGDLKKGQTAEAGNMKFETRQIGEADLATRGIKVPPGDPDRALSWYVHQHGRLLDRLDVDVTDHVEATKLPGAWLIASRTDPRFDDDPTYPNRWRPITRKGSNEVMGKPTVSQGGGSYVLVRSLKTVEGALLVEAHFAFLEPKGWFDGAPILKSKIGIVAQDRVRALRRELSKSQR